jgi:ssDNA-binding Zn-finger/Zn-ribbon topoisomerase 1
MSLTKNKQKQVIADYLQKIKSKTPCSDCQLKYSYWIMDFDHVYGKKLFNIAQYQNKTYTLEMIKEEVAKCEIVCSNCHRHRTHMRLIESKKSKAS